jgi:hypothetical protein
MATLTPSSSSSAPTTVPTTAPMTAPHISTRTVLDLPVPGSRNAPTKFKGGYRKVRKFIDHYEKLLKYCNVTLDEEKCQSILMYCSRSVSHFIEALDSYDKNDWSALKKDLLKYYDADLDKIRWSERDLVPFVNNRRSKESVLYQLGDLTRENLSA